MNDYEKQKPSQLPLITEADVPAPTNAPEVVPPEQPELIELPAELRSTASKDLAETALQGAEGQGGRFGNGVVPISPEQVTPQMINRAVALGAIPAENVRPYRPAFPFPSVHEQDK